MAAVNDLVVHEYPDIQARTVGEPDQTAADAIWQAVWDWAMRNPILATAQPGTVVLPALEAA